MRSASDETDAAHQRYNGPDRLKCSLRRPVNEAIDVKRHQQNKKNLYQGVWPAPNMNLRVCCVKKWEPGRGAEKKRSCSIRRTGGVTENLFSARQYFFLRGPRSM